MNAQYIRLVFPNKTVQLLLPPQNNILPNNLAPILTSNSSIATQVQSTTNSTYCTSSPLQSSISNDEAKRSDDPLNHKTDNVMNPIGNVFPSAATPSPPSKLSRTSRSSNKENGTKVSRKHASTSVEEKHKRSKNWTDEDTKLLIEVWSEHSEQLRAGGSRNTPIYNNMAQQIKELTSSDRLMTSYEVKTKIFNLVAEYRRRKIDQGKSGGSPSSWRFFDRIDQIIGSRPYNDDSLLSDTIVLTNENNPESLDDVCFGGIGADSVVNQNRPSPMMAEERKEATATDSTPMINSSTTNVPQVSTTSTTNGPQVSTTSTTNGPQASTTSKTPEQPQRKIQSSKKKRLGDSKIELMEKMLTKIDHANEAANKSESKALSLLERQTQLQEESLKNEKEFLQVFRTIANKMNSLE